MMKSVLKRTCESLSEQSRMERNPALMEEVVHDYMNN